MMPEVTILGPYRCSCGESMAFPSLRGDGTAYDKTPGQRRRIMCENPDCPRFGVRYLEPSFPVAETD